MFKKSVLYLLFVIIGIRIRFYIISIERSRKCTDITLYFFSPRCRPYYHKLIGISKNTYIQSVSKICVYINLKDEKYVSPGSHIRCQVNYNVWISVTSYALVISVDIKLGRFKFCVGYQSFFYRSLKSSPVLSYSLSDTHFVISLIIPKMVSFLNVIYFLKLYLITCLKDYIDGTILDVLVWMNNVRYCMTNLLCLV